MFISDTRAHY